MKIDDFGIGRHPANHQVAARTCTILAIAPDYAGNVRTMAVAIVRAATERVVVVDDSIMALRILQILCTVHSTIDNSNSDTGAVQAKAPRIGRDYRFRGVIQMALNYAVRRNEGHLWIIGKFNQLAGFQ